MKRLLSIFVIAVLFVVLAGCEKPEEKAEDRYYVKYEVSIVGGITYSDIYVTVNTEKGVESFFAKGGTFSETFGPVNHDFVAKIKAYTTRYSKLYIRIYACKGEESFVLKKTVTKDYAEENSPAEAEYRIDF